MRVSRVVWIILACGTAIVACGALLVWLLWPRIETWGVGVHQKSVTRELAEWGQEYSNISNDASAIRAAAEMVGYMSHYYVPGSGYRGPVEVEVALETQRRESIDRIVASLEQYTGLDLGTNAERWMDWAHSGGSTCMFRAAANQSVQRRGARRFAQSENGNVTGGGLPSLTFRVGVKDEWQYSIPDEHNAAYVMASFIIRTTLLGARISLEIQMILSGPTPMPACIDRASCHGTSGPKFVRRYNKEMRGVHHMSKTGDVRNWWWPFW